MNNPDTVACLNALDRVAEAARCLAMFDRWAVSGEEAGRDSYAGREGVVEGADECVDNVRVPL